MINEDKWQSLSSDQQQAILQALETARRFVDETNLAAEAELIDFFEAEGMTIITPDKQAFIDFARDKVLGNEEMAAARPWVHRRPARLLWQAQYVGSLPARAVIEDPLLAMQVIIDAGILVDADGVRQFIFPARRTELAGNALFEVNGSGRRLGAIDIAGGLATHLAASILAAGGL